VRRAPLDLFELRIGARQAPEPGTDERSPLRTDHSALVNNAKVRAERTLMKLRANGKTELVMLRPGIVYGPRSR